MKMIVLMAALAMSGTALATQNHTCQGGHNCNTNSQPSSQDQDQNQDQAQAQLQGQLQGQQQAAVGVGVGIGQGGAGGAGGNASVGGVGNGVGNFSPSANGGDVDAEFKDLVDNTNVNANTAFGGQGGDADSHSSSGVFGSGNSDVDVNAYGVKGDVEGGDALAFGGNQQQGQIGINKQGDQTQSGVNVSENDNASSASNGDQVTNVQVGGEGAPLSASTQNVEGSSLTVEDNTQTTYRNKSLALALPGASADYGSTAPCLESRRGWTFVGNGASGRTRINVTCFEETVASRKQNACIAIADRYYNAGMLDHFVAQLSKEECGGAVEVEVSVFGEEFIAPAESAPALPPETRIGG